MPHAGYRYSAHIAAHVYAALYQQDWIKRIVIVAPNHQTAAAGGLVCSHTEWLSPAGSVAIDRAFIRQHWAGLGHITVDDAVHQAEYSIEVQLPFIKRVFPEVSIVPIVLGECTTQQTVALLRPAWDCAETLLLVSSDLYHYLPRASALSAARTISRALERNEAESMRPETACGYVALRGLMQLVVEESCCWRTLAVGHSGEYNGIAAEGLVGYGAFLLLKPSVCRLTV